MEAGTRFEDAIDIAGRTFSAGNHLQMPYRTLVPEEANGLVVAGRCISVDHGRIGSIRVIPPCIRTGQAVGTAAALSVREGVALREVDPVQLRETLRDAGGDPSGSG